MKMLVLGSRWLAVEHGDSRYRPLGNYAALRGAGRLVWHPERVGVGVASFEGDPRHAVTLLERRLRSQGEISSDVKILILQLQRAGRGYQVLYVTVALDEWQQMLAWAAAQPHICQISLMAALAFKLVQPGRAVVLQADRHFHFFARHDGQLVHLQAVSVDGSLADLESAASLLGIQARDEMTSKGCAQFDVRWVPAAFEGSRADLDALGKAFSAAAQGVAVRLESDAFRAQDGGASDLQAHSGLLALLRQAQPQDWLNQGQDKLHVLAREYLPYGAVVAVVAALGLAYVGYGWTTEASLLRQRALQLQVEEAGVRQSTAAILRDTRLDEAALNKQVEMLAMLRKVQGDHDPVRLLDALRLGTQGGIRILSVGTTRAAQGASGGGAGGAPEMAILVDGTLPENVINSDRDTRALSTLVKTLAGHGYRAEPVDIRSGAGQDTSTRLFSYRLTRIDSKQQGGS